jgi:hypothetical protein
VAHFQHLIEVVASFGVRYAPKEECLTVPELLKLLESARRRIESANSLLPDYLSAVLSRKEAFADLPLRAKRVGSIAGVCDINPPTQSQIREVVRELQAFRPKGYRGAMACQLSYGEQTERFNRLIELVEAQPYYNPAESDLSPSKLKVFSKVLSALNEHVSALEPPLLEARRRRDEMLYGAAGLTERAQAVKEYVKVTFGESSQRYRKVKRIKLANREVPPSGGSTVSLPSGGLHG